MILEFQSKTYETLLNDFWKKYVEVEIAWYRPEIEQLHFLCVTIVLDFLLSKKDEKKKSPEEIENHEREIRIFIDYIIRQREGYLNSNIREDLLELKRNRTNQQFLNRFSKQYKYVMNYTTSQNMEKINHIIDWLAQHKTFQEYLKTRKSLKFSHIPNLDTVQFSNGTFTGLFEYNSQKEKEKKQQIDQKTIDSTRNELMERDIKLVEQAVQDEQFFFNTFIDDDWLQILVQIEKCQKGLLDIQIGINDVLNINEVIKQKNAPYQIARDCKNNIMKQIESSLRIQKESLIKDDREIYRRIKVKLTHDQRLAECLLNPQNYLLGSRLNDTANQISQLCVGKFCNIIVAGTFDGNVIVYELTEQFLLKSSDQQTVEMQQPKKNQTGKLICSSKFDLHLHDGPITALALLYDEFYMLSTSIELIIKISCLRSRQALAVYKGHIQTIWHLSFAPTGVLFLSSSADHSAMLWSTDRIQSLRIYLALSQVKMAEFTPSLEYVVTSEENRSIRLFSTFTGECLYLHFVDSNITCFNISFTGSFLTVGLQNGQIQLYYLPTFKKLKDKIYIQKEERSKSSSRDYIRSISMSYDEQTIICCNSNRIGFFSVANLVKETSEDVFMGMFTGQQILDYQRNNPFRKAQPLELIETPDQLIHVQYLPQGYSVYFSK